MNVAAAPFSAVNISGGLLIAEEDSGVRVSPVDKVWHDV
jgi:hypothetical protein